MNATAPTLLFSFPRILELLFAWQMIQIALSMIVMDDLGPKKLHKALFISPFSPFSIKVAMAILLGQTCNISASF